MSEIEEKTRLASLLPKPLSLAAGRTPGSLPHQAAPISPPLPGFNCPAEDDKLRAICGNVKGA